MMDPTDKPSGYGSGIEIAPAIMFFIIVILIISLIIALIAVWVNRKELQEIKKELANKNHQEENKQKE